MKIAKWNDEFIEFSDGSKITYDHEQDCCEYNYADFEVLDVFYNGEEFVDYRIEPVKYGMNLVLIQDDYAGIFGNVWRGKTIYIPFYSEQNGYYTSDLCVIVTGKDKVVIGPMESYEVGEALYNENDLKRSIESGELDGCSVIFCSVCGKTILCRSNYEAKSAATHHMAQEHKKAMRIDAAGTYETKTVPLRYTSTRLNRVDVHVIEDDY